ncbi:hypothetical protein [Streptomyces antibioticus]|nr:hypothetical protein [Streptomyces antibioticus]MCX4740735.1 hypothetical protein [Streptomyces antibioticus]MCX4740747.1 hypothetical protein [Streptomyces antibioticus]
MPALVTVPVAGVMYTDALRDTLAHDTHRISWMSRKNTTADKRSTSR